MVSKNNTEEKRRHKRLFFLIFVSHYLTPTILVDGDNNAVDDLIERISKAKMLISIKAMFFQMYKLPSPERWSGTDGFCTKIATNL